MTRQHIERWFADVVAQLNATLNELGNLPVVEGWHLCLAIAIASALVAAIVVRLAKTIAAWYIEYKKKQIVKEEWGIWRRHGLPKEALHAVAYYCFALIVLKIGFELARASGSELPIVLEITANVVSFLVLLVYALWQLKARHTGTWIRLTVRYTGCTFLCLLALHHSDIIRRFAAPATVYALDALPL